MKKVKFDPDEFGFGSHICDALQELGLPVNREACEFPGYGSVIVSCHPYAVLHGDTLVAFEALLTGTATEEQKALLQTLNK